MLRLLPSIHPDSLFADASAVLSFRWWYVDVLDAEGNGVVCIFSEGLPFLPESATPRRERPSVNIVLYEGGVEQFYLLQEFDASDMLYQTSQTDDGLVERWQIGAHIFQRKTLNGVVAVDITLSTTSDTSLAHALHGAIRFEGALCQTLIGEAQCAHQWIPMVMNTIAQVQLDTQLVSFDFEGRVYHDSNISTKPLTQLDIAHWWWGRVPFADGDLIFYLLWPTGDSESQPIQIALMVGDAESSLYPVSTTHIDKSYTSIYGLTHPHHWQILLEDGRAIQVSVRSKLDDAPFYQRFLIDVTLDGQTALGFMEHVVPTQLGIPWQQPFVRMKTHYKDQACSFFSPLFTGPQKGRWARQIQYLFSA